MTTDPALRALDEAEVYATSNFSGEHLNVADIAAAYRAGRAAGAAAEAAPLDPGDAAILSDPTTAFVSGLAGPTDPALRALATTNRLALLLHEMWKHDGGIDSLCRSTAAGFEQEYRAALAAAEAAPRWGDGDEGEAAVLADWDAEQRELAEDR